MDLKYGLISADDHVQEHAEVWTGRMSRQKWGDRIPHVETQSDGTQLWKIDGVPVNAQAELQIAREELRRATSDAGERLKAMDAEGIDYSILYPTVAGLAGERFGAESPMPIWSSRACRRTTTGSSRNGRR
jgi:hypothetical protein